MIDAIVSVDAFHYFGTDDLYLQNVSNLLKPDGVLAVAVPGVREELEVLPPGHLAEHWSWDFCSFHSPGWWRRHWERTGLVQVVHDEWLPNGRDLWLRWERALTARAAERGLPRDRRDEQLLERDTDGLLGFSLIAARLPKRA